jgi:hypothetical protein
MEEGKRAGSLRLNGITLSRKLPEMGAAAATLQYSCPRAFSATIFRGRKRLRPKRLSHELKPDFTDRPALRMDVDRPEQFGLQK